MAKRLSDISGFQYVVSYPYTITDEEPAKYAFKQAVQDGKIALSIESGKLGLVEEDTVALTVHGVLNMLHEMGMYPPTLQLTQTVFSSTTSCILGLLKEASSTVSLKQVIM